MTSEGRVKAIPTGLYKSKLEARVAEQIASSGLPVAYEKHTFKYTTSHNYKVDFSLANGIHIEVKGYFTPEDRSKLKRIKEEYPSLDLRLVFQKASNRLSKESSTTYGEWATLNGFPWSDNGIIPEAWLQESKTNRKAE